MFFFSGDFFASGLAAAAGLSDGFASLAACGAGAAGAVVTGAVAGEGEGDGCGDGAGADVDCKIEREPVKTGCPNARAINKNEAAAPIVILARMLAVPLGPNAVLETLLVKSEPASALPGCSRITTISTMQLRINSPYRI